MKNEKSTRESVIQGYYGGPQLLAANNSCFLTLGTRAKKKNKIKLRKINKIKLKKEKEREKEERKEEGRRREERKKEDSFFLFLFFNFILFIFLALVPRVVLSLYNDSKT